MSEGADKESKTEQASEKRRRELRDEGKIAQSHDVVSAATLIAAVGVYLDTPILIIGAMIVGPAMPSPITPSVMGASLT